MSEEKANTTGDERDQGWTGEGERDANPVGDTEPDFQAHQGWTGEGERGQGWTGEGERGQGWAGEGERDAYPVGD